MGTDVRMIVYITDPLLTERVKGELVERTGIVASAFEVRVILEIPRSGAGKILYNQLNNQ